MAAPNPILPADPTDNSRNWEDSRWLDPHWAKRLQALSDEASTPENIDPKWMALIALAVDATPQNTYPQGMRRHLRRALEYGATRQEITAVLRYVSLLGQHSLKLGAAILKEELTMRPAADSASSHPPTAGTPARVSRKPARSLQG